MALVIMLYFNAIQLVALPVLINSGFLHDCVALFGDTLVEDHV